MIGIGTFLGHVSAVGTGAVAPPPGAVFYPAVPPVPVLEATGAIQFPEYNGRNIPDAGGNLPQQVNNPRLVYQQTMDFPVPSSATDMQIIVVAGLPLAKRGNDVAARGIFGNSSRNTDGNPATSPQQLSFSYRRDGRLAFKHPGGSITMQGASGTVMPERFAAAFTNIAGTGQTLSVTEIGSGTQQPVVTQNTAYTAISASGNWNIGNLGVVSATNIDGTAPQAAWPGTIEAVYWVIGARVSEAVLQQLARGEVRPQDVLPIANVRYAREGGADGFTKPGWATADTTAATVKHGNRPGRPAAAVLRRSMAGQVYPLNPVEGRVGGLIGGATERAQRFAFLASGPVEVQVYDLADGLVVRDWTALSNHAAGMASGEVMLPRGDHGWYGYRYRLQSHPDIGGHGPLFGVGYKIMALGQSQIDYGLGGEIYGQALASAGNVSVARDISGGVALELVGGNARSDSFVGFANTWAQLAGKIPVMVVKSSVVGSGIGELLYDDNAYINTIYGRSRLRSWAQEQTKFDAIGPDVSAVAWTWFTTDSSDPVVWRRRIDALLYGVQDPNIPVIDHSLATALDPGYAVIHMPAMRGSDGNDYATTMGAWANLKGQTMALPAIDMAARYNESGHANAFAPGPARFGKAMAFGLARATGWTTIANPYFTNARKTAPNVITVDFVPAAGGGLSLAGVSDGSTIRHSWGWSTSGGTNWVWNDNAIVQAQSGNSITLTKTNGNWPAGIQISFSASGAPNQSGDSAAWLAHELAMAAGLPYEAWPGDVLGKGLPILGSMVAGKWQPTFTASLP